MSVLGPPSVSLKPQVAGSELRYRCRSNSGATLRGPDTTCRANRKSLATFCAPTRCLTTHGSGPCIAGLVGAESDVYYAAGSFRPLRSSALTATSRLEPDIERAAISGRRTRPKLGSKTPAAIGIAIEL